MSSMPWTQAAQAAQWAQNYGGVPPVKPEWEKAQQALAQIQKSSNDTVSQQQQQPQQAQIYHQYNSMMLQQQYGFQTEYRQRPAGPNVNYDSYQPPPIPPPSPDSFRPPHPQRNYWAQDNKQAPGAGGIRFQMPKRSVQNNNALYETSPIQNKKAKECASPQLPRMPYSRTPQQRGVGQGDQRMTPPPQKEQQVTKENKEVAAGEWPPDLRAYVERAFNSVSSQLEKDFMEKALKEMLTSAFGTGAALVKNWDKEPLPVFNGKVNHWTPYNSLLRPFGQENGNMSDRPTAGRGQNNERGRGRKNQRPRSPPGFKRDYRPNFRSRSRSRTPPSHRKDRRRQYSSDSESDDSSTTTSCRGSFVGRGRGRGGMQSRLNKNQKVKGKVARRGKKGNARNDFMVDDSPDKRQKLQKRAARFIEHLGQKKQRRTQKLVLTINNFTDGADDDLMWTGEEAIVGTCQDLEKNYFRLTAAPDSMTVRPIDVLKKSLEHVKKKWKENQDYRWTCEQFKSIRQDLTVQCVRDSFIAKVYETHARVAMEVSDHEEFNQCQTQLKSLYHEGIEGNRAEFMAYRILYYIFTSNSLDMTTVLAQLSCEDKKDDCIKHALTVRSAWSLDNYHKFFKLYQSAPKMSGYLLDWFLERVRKQAFKVMAKAFRQVLPVDYIQTELAFEDTESCRKFLDSLEVVYSKDKSKVDMKLTSTKISQLTTS